MEKILTGGAVAFLWVAVELEVIPVDRWRTSGIDPDYAL